ncbi:hypothetical protein RQP53_23005 [Paucibacter sp. APW11]|uniref:Type II secretion system protein GspC N-terminal domain-containing protein n=1 Tax=Roseateles aquae TaxID=3077235 RepID=A0ABU3PJ43_9BURK|nr:hypothetical protein [Paucibacter sp. APW11]MDT9002167.1 hypothetical protein [Paucibacter sp. APW11]
MLARIMAFVVWGLLAFAGGYWLLKLAATPLASPASTLPASDRAATRGDLSRLFGAAPVGVPEAAATPAESRFRLVGLVAPKMGGRGHEDEGVALIAIDGGAPRTVRVGALVDADVRLLALRADTAMLGGDNQAQFELKLAPAAAPATGSLPIAAPAPGIQPGQGFAPMAVVNPQAPMPGQVAPTNLPPMGGANGVPQRQ